MILCADARHIPLKDKSVQCCVTSPPYFNLRDYQTAKWVGGDSTCDHRHQLGGEGTSSAKQNTSKGTQTLQYRHVCGKCGAVRHDLQLGMELTIDDYVANIVVVCREVRRVLKDSGLLWINLGDSFAANRSYQVTDNKHVGVGNIQSSSVPVGLKPKDLIGMPWAVAFALRDDGWWLRSDIVWNKLNPMPESITDRPTRSHEYIFLMSKSAKYFYDYKAIKEPAVNDGKIVRCGANSHADNDRVPGGNKKQDMLGKQTYTVFNDRWANKPCDGRNKRSVWNIATQPYSGSHFATFPEEIPRTCILAGSRPGDVILDPFGGSGTTAKVAIELGRKPIHLDLTYFDLAKKRTSTTMGFGV